MAERMITVRGVRLCAESFGDPGRPPVLLIMGTGASMLWWEDDFCRMLAAGGRFVIRYDHRDTGRSVTCAPGHPGYDSGDLVADAVGVLDAFGIQAAHLVGVSAGGALAQLVALDHPDRVSTLTLISTTFAVSSPRDGELPGPTREFIGFRQAAHPDWTDRESMIDHLVGYAEVLAGGRRPFPAREVRELVRADLDRAHNPAAARNHDLLADVPRDRPPLAGIRVPTLVVHGAADPMFPLQHGKALAEEIPGARLLVLPDSGHGVARADWAALASAIHEHTCLRSGPNDYDAELRRHNEILRRACGVQCHDHVLDIGCGTGQTTREAARTARAGSVLGVDVSAPAVARARVLARTAGIGNVRFEHADAQHHRFPPERFDLAISRFGTMFFDDPVAAFSNIGRALRPAGRLVMMVWQAHERNEWDVVIRQSLHTAQRSAAGSLGGADPFSLADQPTVRRILTAAGFAGVTFTDVHEPVYYGPDVATALDWVRGFTCTSEVLRRLDPADATRAVGRLREALAAQLCDDGVWFDSRAWVVTARRR